MFSGIGIKHVVVDVMHMMEETFHHEDHDHPVTNSSSTYSSGKKSRLPLIFSNYGGYDANNVF